MFFQSSPQWIPTAQSAKFNCGEPKFISGFSFRRQLIKQMPDSNDRELVREFAREKSETAFAALVQQHVNLVFATALRQIGDRTAAEEITQTVFVALAQSAGKLGSH